MTLKQYSIFSVQFAVGDKISRRLFKWLLFIYNIMILYVITIKDKRNQLINNKITTFNSPL